MTTEPESAAAPSGAADLAADDERRLAASLFNGAWRLLEQPDRGDEDDDALIHMAHASRHHWGQVGGPENRARGEWQCSHVYAVLGRAEPAIYHAERCLTLCARYDLRDLDLAFAHEAAARAYAVRGDAERARRHVASARSVPVADEEDRGLLQSDLATIPGVDG